MFERAELICGGSPGGAAGAALDRQQARVLVDYKVRVKEPKSHNGKRTLPLDDDLVSALVELRKRQAHDSETAEAAYGAVLADLDWYTEGDKYVVTDELGTPLHPGDLREIGSGTGVLTARGGVRGRPAGRAGVAGNGRGVPGRRGLTTRIFCTEDST